MSAWTTLLAHAWPAVLLSAIALALLRASRSPGISRGDAVVVDLCLGLAATVASVPLSC